MIFKNLIIGIIFISFIACKESIQKSKKETQPPIVEFNLSDIQENREGKFDFFVNDLEKLLTKEQNNDLDNYLVQLKKETGKSIQIITIPSKEKLNKDWSIENGFTNSGVLITVSESLKTVGIGVANETESILTVSTREKIIKKDIIPEFQKGNYYKGIKAGISGILKKLGKS